MEKKYKKCEFKTFDVENLLVKNDNKILCLQEVEVTNNLHPETLKLKNYQFEMEVNSLKSRTGTYIRNLVRYRIMA